MGYKKNPRTGDWVAYFSKRHPITRTPFTRRRKGLKSEAEAKRAERELIAEVEVLLHRKVTPTWATMLDRFLASCRERGLTEHTIHDYETSLKAHTLQAWGDRPIDEITSQDVRDLIKERVSEKSASHQKNLRKFINGVFVLAVEAGEIDRNPVPKMHFSVGLKMKRFLTEDQVRTFLDKAKLMDWEWYAVLGKDQKTRGQKIPG